MSCSGNRCAPLNNRIAFFAECSAGVSVFNASWLFVNNSNRCVNMGCPMLCKICFINSVFVGIHFSVNMEFLIGESTGRAVNMSNKTHIDIKLHILRPEFICRPVCLCSITRNKNIRIKINNANWKLRQHCSSGLGIVTGTRNSDSGCICFGSDGILCREAFSKLHVFKFPMVYIIQINYGRNSLNCFNRICLKIHPVNRTEGNSVKCRIGRNKFQCRIARAGFNLDYTYDNRLVACIITDFKFHTVISICHGNIGCRKNTP